MSSTTSILARRQVGRFALIVMVLAALAGARQAVAGDRVPFRGSDAGIWGEGSHACGSLYPVFVSTAGTALHVGRYSYASRECVDFSASAYAGTWEITAADGSTVRGTYAGTFTVVDGVIHYEQENIAAGGSVRYAEARGSFHVSGLASLDDFSDTQVFDGWLSTVGSAK